MILKQAAALLLLSGVAAVGTHLLHPLAPAWYLTDVQAGADEVTVKDVAERWKNDVVWVDARTEERYKEEHIPGAILINEYNRDDAVFENLERLQTSGKPIVIYCDGQKCEASHQMREYLTTNVALPDVWVLTGGWTAWKAGHSRTGR
jgi:rhodanese-related sulfurtransferase